MEKNFIRILLNNLVRDVEIGNKEHMIFIYESEFKGVRLHADVTRNIHNDDYTITIRLPDYYRAPFTDNICCPVSRIEQIIAAVKEYDKKASIRSDHHLCSLDFRIISERGDMAVYPNSLADHITLDFARKISTDRHEFDTEISGLLALLSLYFTN